MTRGYLTFVQNNSETDYLTLAYAQAMSIKATQTVNAYAVVVDADTKRLITDRHKQVFDYIIDIPGIDEAAADSWKLKNEWKALLATPFDETVKLEADMLFTCSVDHWWGIMSQQDVCFTTNVVDYTGRVSNNRAYRKVFDDNNLLDLYNGFYYFKRSAAAESMFNYARLIYAHWPLFRDQILSNCRDPEPTTDLVFAIAVKLAGQDQYHNPATQIPRFTHMKGAINGWEIDADWQDRLQCQFDDSTVTVGFTRQQVPFHYHQKEFVTTDIIKHYEKQCAIN